MRLSLKLVSAASTPSKETEGGMLGVGPCQKDSGE